MNYILSQYTSYNFYQKLRSYLDIAWLSFLLSSRPGLRSRGSWRTPFGDLGLGLGWSGLGLGLRSTPRPRPFLNLRTGYTLSSVYSSPLSLGAKWVSWGVWVGSGRFEPKEHRRRKDRAAFVVGVWEGGIPVRSWLRGIRVLYLSITPCILMLCKIFLVKIWNFLKGNFPPRRASINTVHYCVELQWLMLMTRRSLTNLLTEIIKQSTHGLTTSLSSNVRMKQFDCWIIAATTDITMSRKDRPKSPKQIILSVC